MSQFYNLIKSSKSTLFITLLCVALISIKTLLFSLPINPMSWDVFGYYLYLPLSIIHQDLRIENFSIIDSILETYNNTPTFYQAHKSPIDHWVIKYPIGMAIFYFPFFIIGHVFALYSDYPVDGFSKPYYWSVVIGHLFYVGLGLLITTKVLLKYFKPSIATATILCLALGTNYFHQAGSSVAMTHTLIFCQYAITLFIFSKWTKNPSNLNSIVLGLMMGLTVATRPTEVVILAFPFLYGLEFNKNILKSFFSNLKTKYKPFLRLTLGFILGILPQLIYWKYTTGSFVYYSYQNPGEGLDLFSPHTIPYLFSFRKGWLIYTPMMIFAIAGIYAIYRTKKALFLPVLIFFIANLYLASSWTNWWYGFSFGQRSIVQSYAIMAIPLAGFLSLSINYRSFFRVILTIVLIALIPLNLFQTWQIDKGILDGSRMTSAFYFASFGQTERSPEWEKLLLVKRSDTGHDEPPSFEGYKNRVIAYQDYERGKGTDKYAFEGNYSYVLSKDQEYSPSTSIPFEYITNKDHAWIEIEAQIYLADTTQECNVMLTAAMTHKQKSYFWKGHEMKNEVDLKPHQWTPVKIYYLTPEIRNTRDKLSIYFWYRPGAELYVDKLIVRAYTPNK